jgi:hypothetical protein
MKTFFTLLAALFVTSVVFAGPRPASSLTVRSADKTAIVVFIDGKCFDLGINSVMITDLQPSYHQVKVYQKKFNGSADYFDKNYNVLFNSSILIKPRTSFQISIDDCGDVTMSEAKIKNPRFGDTWKGSDNDIAANYGFDGGYSKGINSGEFDRVLWAVGKESSEANKMRSAQQIINTNYFTTEQVKKLLDLFCIESNKLELAKLAYDKTVDQSNYYVLDNIFTFSSSRDELARCIHDH